jgi:aryl-alcohol dehydrogenase-like predicted oxidoreductase
LSLGSWVTYHNQVDTRAAAEMMAAAFDAGVNFFDNAEVYAARPERGDHGRGAEEAGLAAAELRRQTKFFWGLDREGNAVNRRTRSTAST